MALWFKVDVLPASAWHRMSDKLSGGTKEFIMYLDDVATGPYLVYAVGGASSKYTDGAVAYTIGKWNHAAYVKNGTTETYDTYVNGIHDIGPIDFSGVYSATNTGNIIINGGTQADVSYDDFRYYDRVLTAPEIATLAQNPYSAAIGTPVYGPVMDPVTSPLARKEI